MVRSKGVVIMTIEFIDHEDCVNVHLDGVSNPDASIHRTGECIYYHKGITMNFGEQEAIIAKMKELQSEVKK